MRLLLMASPSKAVSWDQGLLAKKAYKYILKINEIDPEEAEKIDKDNYYVWKKQLEYINNEKYGGAHEYNKPGFLDIDKTKALSKQQTAEGENKYYALGQYKSFFSGFCVGLSLVWLHSMANDKMEWFNDCYFALAAWNETDDFTPEQDKEIKTFVSTIRHLQNENQYSLNTDSLESVHRVGDKTVIKTIKKPKTKNLQYIKDFGPLEDAIADSVHDGVGALVKIHLSCFGHATAVFQKDGKVIFFDPNAEYNGIAQKVDTVNGAAKALWGVAEEVYEKNPKFQKNNQNPDGEKVFSFLVSPIDYEEKA